MKLLQILKSEPDEVTESLIQATSEGHEVQTFRMFGDSVDYRTLVKLIFENDKNISWW